MRLLSVQATRYFISGLREAWFMRGALSIFFSLWLIGSLGSGFSVGQSRVHLGVAVSPYSDFSTYIVIHAYWQTFNTRWTITLNNRIHDLLLSSSLQNSHSLDGLDILQASLELGCLSLATTRWQSPYCILLFRYSPIEYSSMLPLWSPATMRLFLKEEVRLQQADHHGDRNGIRNRIWPRSDVYIYLCSLHPRQHQFRFDIDYRLQLLPQCTQWPDHVWNTQLSGNFPSNVWPLITHHMRIEPLLENFTATVVSSREAIPSQ